MLADAARHFEQDAVDLGLLFVEQAHQVVVLLDGLDRLDEDRLAARTAAVNHAGNAPLVLDLDRNDETLAANRDQFILHGSAFAQPAQIPAQGILNGALLLLDLAPDTREFR